MILISYKRFDRRILGLRKELGLEGYGILCMLIEVLAEQEDFKYPIQDINLLVDEFKISEEKIRAVIYKYGLFDVDDKHFGNKELSKNLESCKKKKTQAKQAIMKRWKKTKKEKNQDEIQSSNTTSNTTVGTGDNTTVDTASNTTVSQGNNKSIPEGSIASLWNEICYPCKFPKVVEFSEVRKRKERMRLSERTIESWRDVLTKITKSPFLRGNNSAGWRATYDWIISNSENSIKVLEGKYEKVEGETLELEEEVERLKKVFEKQKNGFSLPPTDQ
jgi:uncharacterized protein YdaU (DUF1376 family)